MENDSDFDNFQVFSDVKTAPVDCMAELTKLWGEHGENLPVFLDDMTRRMCARDEGTFFFQNEFLVSVSQDTIYPGSVSQELWDCLYRLAGSDHHIEPSGRYFSLELSEQDFDEDTLEPVQQEVLSIQVDQYDFGELIMVLRGDLKT